jgi:hypothetical protein
VHQEARPSLLTRFAALLVLVVAALFLIKIAINVIAGLSIFVGVIVAVVAVLWALSKF